jgi:hypothetical protein
MKEAMMEELFITIIIIIDFWQEIGNWSSGFL